MAKEALVASIQDSSLRLRKGITILVAILWSLLLLERFGWTVAAIATHRAGLDLARRIVYQFVAACPEVFYLLSLWWIREALASFARGDLYAPVISQMLRRVGGMLAAGACLNAFVVPSVDRWLGFSPGYWIAFDVAGLVLAAVGLSLAIVARVLDRARGLKTELDEIF
ncbi:MAG TPA: DUF2975 domain-containing protein [Candidatus Angelobacter sp.]|nr:DUF2975 domain-containing protein [Candidatus Angelobacter sp.]